MSSQRLPVRSSPSPHRTNGFAPSAASTAAYGASGHAQHRQPLSHHLNNGGVPSPSSSQSQALPMSRRSRLTPDADSRFHSTPLSSSSAAQSVSSSSSARRKLSPTALRRPPASPTYDLDDEEDAYGGDNARGLSKQPPGLSSPLSLFSSATRSPAIVTAARYILLIIVAVLCLRAAYHYVLDRHKADSFTIVAVLRDFTPAAADSDAMRHAFAYTALQSWAALVLGRNLLIFADSISSCDYVLELVRGARCEVVRCWHEESRRPLLSCVMQALPSLVSTPTVVFVNGEYAVHPSLTPAIAFVASKHASFLMVAARSTVEAQAGVLDAYTAADFLPSVFAHAASKGQRGPPATHTADLFVFPLSLLSLAPFSSFPPFLAGVYRWDQWLLSTCILDESVTVVDASSAVLVVQQQKPQPSPPSKAGTAYNDQLVKRLSGNSYRVGLTDNAGLVLVGLCPACELVANSNMTDVVLFTKRASAGGYLVVLTVNSGYISLALNWVCWAKRIHFDNYILIAEDQQAATKFRSHGCPVIVRRDAPMEKPAADYGSVQFQETMTFRTEFLMSVLQAGFHFVTADMDGLWLDDPLQYLNDAVDLQGQPHKETKISGGFVVVRATSYGRYFWQQVIDCQRRNAAFLATAKPGSYEPASYTEQYCVNELSHGLSSQPLFSKGLLDPWLFPDGRSFFDEQNSQLRGIMPAVIHNNWIKGTQQKLDRLHAWKLHSADEEKEVCLDIPRLAPPALPSPAFRPRLSVRVLAGQSPSQLQSLLAVLARDEYLGDKVELTVVVAADGGRAEEVRKVAAEFSWQHGEKRLEEAAAGKRSQWTGWRPATDEEVALVLEEDVQLSPGWYAVCRALLHRYYSEGADYDHRLYGLSLTRPSIIIGETFEQRWGSAIPSDLLPASSSAPLYKYQLLSQSAIVLFPHRWRDFLRWLEEAEKDRSFSPCTPTLITNSFYAQDSRQHWAAAFHRFAFEHGLYSLYLNLPDNAALAVAAQDYAAELMMRKQRATQAVLLPNATLQLGSDGGRASFPASASVPVFDFHFKLVNVVDTLSWRQHLTPPQFFPNQCWVLQQLEAKLTEDAVRMERERVDKVKTVLAKAEADKTRKAEEEKAKQDAAKAAKAAAPAASPPAPKAAPAAHAPAGGPPPPPQPPPPPPLPPQPAAAPPAAAAKPAPALAAALAHPPASPALPCLTSCSCGSSTSFTSHSRSLSEAAVQSRVR